VKTRGPMRAEAQSGLYSNGGRSNRRSIWGTLRPAKSERRRRGGRPMRSRRKRGRCERVRPAAASGAVSEAKI